MAEGFTCECGQYHRYGGYVAAHWSTELVHTCPCGRKHLIFRGRAKLMVEREETTP